MDKTFYKSKQFWVYVAAIITASGSAMAGEVSWEKIVSMIVIDVLGILGIIFRWNKGQPMGGLKWK